MTWDVQVRQEDAAEQEVDWRLITTGFEYVPALLAPPISLTRAMFTTPRLEHHVEPIVVTVDDWIDTGSTGQVANMYFVLGSAPWEHRLAELRALMPDEGETRLREGAVQRGRQFLSRLTRPQMSTRQVRRPFLTVTGAGDLQLEWKQGDRYFEVEIPPTGPLSVWYETPTEEAELQLNSIEDLDEALASFFKK